jgi:hypothetical protein
MASASLPANRASACKSGADEAADFSYRFPGIAEAVRGLSADEALIDGERSWWRRLVG